jgi:CRISPR-associated protein Cas2
MSEAVHRFLIAYDIVDDKRRIRISTMLESFGDRIQYSVFIVDAKPAKLSRLSDKLHTLMSGDADSALICDLGPSEATGPARIRYLGRRRPITSDAPLIL